jgi:GDP-4-dehydro-6-deoxy-D-mannose reductase
MSEVMNKKVLITGVNGFVGRHLVNELVKNSYEVYGLTRADDRAIEENYSVIVGDVLDSEGVYEVLKSLKPDVVVHLAAQAKPGYSFGHAKETLEVNVFGTLSILDSVKRLQEKGGEYRPRILAIGTSEEYGVVKQEELPLSEDARLAPTNPYAISKVACYHLVQEYVKTYGLDIVYAVPFSHIGPGQREGFLVSDVAKQIVEIERGEKEPVLTTGPLETERDYTDVRDMVRAYRMLIESGESGERYNLCSGGSVTVESVVEMLCGLAKVEIQHVIDESRRRPTELPILYGNHQKMTGLTGWQTEIALERTLADALEGWRSAKCL